MRYFATEAARDAATIPYKEWMAVVKQERIDRAKATAQRSANKAWAKDKERRRLIREAKGIVKAMQAKPKATAARKTVDAPVQITHRRDRAWWSADAQPVITSETKVTICPSRFGAYRTSTHEDSSL